ncbi:putative Protein YghO [Desulfovibrionales bacterium]
MPLIEIIPITHGTLDMETFLKLPWKIQKHDPCWVPPILSEQRKLLDPARSPFFDHGEAQYFLARKDGEPAGRLSVHLNRLHDERYNDNTGFFGFFECIEDSAVAAVLLEAAATWLRAPGRMRTRIVGPLGFSIYDEVGVLVKGFDRMPVILQTHNPPWYDTILTAWGLTKAMDWYALGIYKANGILENLEGRAAQILQDTAVTMIKPVAADVLRRAEEMRLLFNETWENNWGHVPFTKRHFHQIIYALKPLLKMELNRFILDKNDHIVAFIINIPDFNSTIKRLNGRLNLIGFIRLFCESAFNRFTKTRTLIMGVKREYQGKNLHHAMISDYIAFMLRHFPRVTFDDCSLIAESNKSLLRSLRPYKPEYYKTWRIYERSI